MNDPHDKNGPHDPDGPHDPSSAPEPSEATTQPIPRLTEADPDDRDDPIDKPPVKRSRIALVTVSAATLAIAVGVIVGVSMYQTPTRNDQVRDDLRAGVPDAVASSADTAPGTSPSASPSGSASPSASASPSGSASPSPSAGVTSPAQDASPAPSVSAAPAPSPSGTADEAPRVLRLGDTGAQVVELQERLRQVGRYSGEADGVYDDDVQQAVRTYQFTRLILDDESGVYGAATRKSLESETQRP